MLCIYLISKMNIYNIVRYILCVDKDQNETRNVDPDHKKVASFEGDKMTTTLRIVRYVYVLF
jgi:hypothetical protein